jgi:hypothetical protein
MHKLQDIQHLLTMFITLHLRNAASLASVKMVGLPDLFLSETDPHSRNRLIILVIVELLGAAESGYSQLQNPDIPDETRLRHVHKNDWRNNVP